MEKIIKCRKCDLYENQEPLLEIEEKNTDIMFLGMSAVKIKKNGIKSPLAKDTRTGKMIKEIEELAGKEVWKSNMTRCLPLDKKGKIRAPKKIELMACYENYRYEIKIKNPKIVVLLGAQVSGFILDRKIVFPKLNDCFSYEYIEKDGIKYLAVHHPSYILKTKSNIRERYKDVIASLIK
ncbi:MAG: uracil-DNA glycosylase family protein [Cetobacterium sp.]|uniref:uracil-DNA glycosylase family protein n=1 Tax=Cetobacterium sp. TaxID=2071632 RepID=UPI003F344882